MIKYALALTWVIGIRVFIAVFAMTIGKWIAGILMLLFALFEAGVILYSVIADDPLYQKYKSSCCLSITREE